MSPEKIWLSVKGKHEDSTTGSSITLDENAIKLDAGAQDYIHIDKTNGIDIFGHSVKVNGEPVWERGDIVYSSSTPTSGYPTDRAWLWVKPTGVDSVTSSWSGSASNNFILSGGTVLNTPTEGGFTYNLTLYDVATYYSGSGYTNTSVTVVLTNTVAAANGVQSTKTLTKTVTFQGSSGNHSKTQNLIWNWTESDLNLFNTGGTITCTLTITYNSGEYGANTYNVQGRAISAALTGSTATSGGAGSQCIVYYFSAGTHP